MMARTPLGPLACRREVTDITNVTQFTKRKKKEAKKKEKLYGCDVCFGDEEAEEMSLQLISLRVFS